MLAEMEQALGRLHNFGLSSSWAVQNFTALHEMFRRDLECIQSSQQHPRVMRILAEECVECIEDIFDRLGIGLAPDPLQHRPSWPLYLSGLRPRVLLDHDYIRYLAATTLADPFLQTPSLPETDIQDYHREP